MASAPGTETAAPNRFAPVLERGILVRAAIILVLVAFAVVVLPSLVGSDWITTLTSVAEYSVVSLGLGILYGRVGMISLGQTSLLIVGVWTGTRLSYGTSLPFPLLLLAAGAVACVIGVLIGLPALRLSGLYLALITLMMAGAVIVTLTAINFPNGGHGFTGRTTLVDLSGLQPVRRPSMAVGDTAYYRYVVVVCALMFVLALLHVASKPGRAWASIRESEPAALAAGVNITLYKMWAFALASFMAGVAGCLLAAQVGTADRSELPDPGLADAPRDDADRRHLQPLGRGRLGRLQPVGAVHLPGAVGHQPELPADHLRRGPDPGAADRSRRARAAVPEGHGEPGPAARPRGVRKLGARGQSA